MTVEWSAQLLVTGLSFGDNFLTTRRSTSSRSTGICWDARLIKENVCLVGIWDVPPILFSLSLTSSRESSCSKQNAPLHSLRLNNGIIFAAMENGQLFLHLSLLFRVFWNIRDNDVTAEDFYMFFCEEKTCNIVPKWAKASFYMEIRNVHRRKSHTKAFWISTFSFSVKRILI